MFSLLLQLLEMLLSNLFDNFDRCIYTEVHRLKVQFLYTSVGNVNVQSVYLQGIVGLWFQPMYVSPSDAGFLTKIIFTEEIKHCIPFPAFPGVLHEIKLLNYFFEL